MYFKRVKILQFFIAYNFKDIILHPKLHTEILNTI